MNPQLADNYDKGTLLKSLQKRFAAGKVMWGQPKIDGVRGLYLRDSIFTGRSLKAFKNNALTRYYSEPQFRGVDGELVVPGGWTQPGLCRLTTSMCNTVKSEEIPHLALFDYVTEQTSKLPYSERYECAQEVAFRLGLQVVPWISLACMEDVLAFDADNLDKGYEGTILRNPDAAVKEGRPSKELELLRIKTFIDFEFIIDELVEAMENRNEAKINELGRTERSTHKENMHGKGMIGGFKGRVLADVVHNGKVLLPKDLPITVGPGELTHKEREEGWRNPQLYLQQIGKAVMFPYGVKDAPRMAIFKSLRAKEDMS